MSLGMADATFAPIAIAQSPSNNAALASTDTPTSVEPKKVALNAGSLGSASNAALKVDVLNGAIAIGGPPANRVGAIVRTAERNAIQRLEQPTTRPRNVVPNIRVPQGNNGGAVLKAIMSPGSIYVRAGTGPTAPLAGYQPSTGSLATVESAFTPQRITAFGTLGNEQKVLARSLLADLLPRLEAGTINEAEFNAGVGLVLQAAQRYQPRAATNAMTPGTPVVGATPSGTQATPVSVVPISPSGTPATPVTPKVATPPTASIPPATTDTASPTTSGALPKPTVVAPNRATSAMPYKPGNPITGTISVRPGIDLANLGEFKTVSLAQIAKRTGVPEGELRVLVLVRHGESLANQGKTFAGNNPGVVTATGGFVRPEPGVFTAMPNGEVLPPGGNISLSDLGKQQATAANVLIRNLRDIYPIKTALTSPVFRAQQTSELMTAGQPPFETSQTVPGLGERGMGRNVGNSKTVNRADITRSADINLNAGGRQVGTVGGKKVDGDTAVPPNSEGGVNMARPISDQTGYEDVQIFDGRISSANNSTVLPALVEGGVIETSHQYTIASTLKRIDPQINTMSLGHGIPNGQPLVVIMRVQQQANGQEPKLTVVDAGYYKGNAAIDQ